jgi:S-formylglutathione hydrolase FrmB
MPTRPEAVRPTADPRPAARRRRKGPRHGYAAPRNVARSLDFFAMVAVFCLLMVIPARVTRLASSDVRVTTRLRGIVSVPRVRGPSDTRPFPVWVWRPPGPGSASIPVLYLLHGYPGGASDAFRSGLAAILNRRLQEGYPPFVVACPDGNGEHHSDTEWANSYNGSEQVMSRVVDSDIAAVEGRHRRTAANRVIAGFSMGGYGAMNIAMQNRGLFGQVISLDGYFVLNDLSDMFGDKPAVMARNDPSAHPAEARGMHVILEEDIHDPLTLVRGQAAWMGGLLAAAGVPAIVRLMPGDHSWAFALRALQDALTYVGEYWQQAAERGACYRPAPRLASGPGGRGRR